MEKKKLGRPQGGGLVAKTTRYRKIKLPGHPLAQKDGQVYAHRAVLFDKIGPGVHSCHWCGLHIAWGASKRNSILADHVDNDKWNNSPENIVPACYRCNLHRHELKSAPVLKETCIHGHELNGSNLYVRPDNGSRQCRACKQAAFNRLYKKRKNEGEIK